jgi:hypothetical protein
MTILFSIFLSTISLEAATFKGVEMADQILSGTKTLLLNGQGERTKFGFRVYIAGLYLESKSSDAAQILASTQFKQVDLKFNRDVSAEKIRSSWQETFEKYCKEGPCADKHKTRLAQFLALHSDVTEGQLISYRFYPGKVEILSQHQLLGSLQDDEFSKIVLSAWLGNQVSSASLQSGLLGKGH